MVKYMKKNSLGILVTADDLDSPIEEVRMSYAEYNELLSRIESAERVAVEARDRAEEEIDAAYTDASTQLLEYKKKMDAEIESVKTASADAVEKAEHEVLKLQVEVEKQINLNANLKRIARERANAKRGLKPKKERLGYVVLFSMQAKEHFKDENGKSHMADVWKTVLQTPYDSTLPLNQIETDIWDDLKHHVLFQMGFRIMQPSEKNGAFQQWFKKGDDDKEEELCGIYKWAYKSNLKSSLWEIAIWHTLPMSDIPVEFRPD